MWKYTLSSEHEVIVTGGAPRVVHVDTDPLWRDHRHRLEAQLPTVWVELDPMDDDDPTAEVLRLAFIGTGHPVPAGKVHLGSCVTSGGLVWHVYGSLEASYLGATT